MSTEIFKQCPACGFVWTCREQFLEDPALILVGYQVNFKYLTAGFFLFNHNCKGATLAVKAIAFKDLYQGPVFKQCLAGSTSCSGHCLHQENLAPCPQMCECSYVRAILQVVGKWPKLPSSVEGNTAG